jgi:hypothetical protein
MRTDTMAKSAKPTKPSITEQILNYCASGRFGVREAIAAATTQRSETKRPPMKQHKGSKAS